MNRAALEDFCRRREDFPEARKMLRREEKPEVQNFPDKEEKPEVLKVPKDGEKGKRLAALKKKFTAEYSHPPKFYARAPGRVNLIGEPIDYCDFAVIRMALNQDILMAVAPNTTGKLNLCNVDKSYPPFSCDINSFQIDGSNKEWHNYVLCGIQGIKDEGGVEGALNGLDIVVGGNIPPSYGLASSSALVCAAALATAHAHQCTLPKLTMAELCARSERHISTVYNDRDQIITFMAQPDKYLLVEYDPLRTTHFSMPKEVTLFLANSLVPIDRDATPKFHTRMKECYLATKLISAYHQLGWREFNHLGEVHKALGLEFLETIRASEKALKKLPYKKDEFSMYLRTTQEDIDKNVFTDDMRDIKEFHLLQRTQHVYSEAKRVIDVHRYSQKQGDNHEAINRMGFIFSASHRCTKYHYDCFHDKLEEMVDLVDKSVVGARQTGVGWGGCFVAVVRNEKVKEFSKLLKEFYNKDPAAKGQDIDTLFFTLQPGPGACVYQNE